jgi:O-antigen/teichoic acid export membrane protein
MGPIAGYWGAGALISLGLNTCLVPMFSALGAALAQAMSYGLIALAILAASRHLLPIPVDWRRLGLCLLIALIAGIALSPALAVAPLTSLLLKSPIGLLVVMLLARLIAPDWFQRGVGTLQRFIVPGRG